MGMTYVVEFIPSESEIYRVRAEFCAVIPAKGGIHFFRPNLFGVARFKRL
jgi:hypothetical protein